MSRYRRYPSSGYYGVGTVGTYLMFWSAVAEGILLAAKELHRLIREKAAEERRRKQAEERARRIAEARPRSLNPPPSPAAVSAQWRKARGLQTALESGPQSPVAPVVRQGRKSRGSVEEALRFGSMLLDLEPTVDSSPVVRLDRAAMRTVIVARNPGLKGWLHRHCPEVVYTTAMRYKQMAAQARRACGLPRDVPLAWVLDGEAIQDAQRAKRTSADLPAARAALSALSADCRNKRSFLLKLDQALGTTHHTRSNRRRRPCPAAARRIDERIVGTLLASTRRLAHGKSERLGAASRERLIRGLLEITEELRRSAGKTSA